MMPRSFRLSDPAADTLAAWATHSQMSQTRFLERMLSRLTPPKEASPTAAKVREAHSRLAEREQARKLLVGD